MVKVNLDGLVYSAGDIVDVCDPVTKRYLFSAEVIRPVRICGRKGYRVLRDNGITLDYPASWVWSADESRLFPCGDTQSYGARVDTGRYGRYLASL